MSGNEYTFTKGLYDLALHERMGNESPGHLPPASVLRVPGGWIYYMFNDRSGDREGVFVPYNEEFKPSDGRWKKDLESLNELTKDWEGEEDDPDLDVKEPEIDWIKIR